MQEEDKTKDTPVVESQAEETTDDTSTADTPSSDVKSTDSETDVQDTKASDETTQDDETDLAAKLKAEQEKRAALEKELTVTKGKYTKAVNESKNRKERLDKFEEDAKAAEEERIANLTLQERLDETASKSEEKDTTIANLQAKIYEGSVTNELLKAGVGLHLPEGEERSKELDRWKTVAQQDTYRVDDKFDVDAFVATWGTDAVKPMTPPKEEKEKVVDIGPSGNSPKLGNAAKISSLQKQLDAARQAGNHAQIANLNIMISNLQSKK